MTYIHGILQPWFIKVSNGSFNGHLLMNHDLFLVQGHDLTNENQWVNAREIIPEPKSFRTGIYPEICMDTLW